MGYQARGRPPMGWRTLAVRDFIRVPFPAARTTAASGLRIRAIAGRLGWGERAIKWSAGPTTPGLLSLSRVRGTKATPGAEGLPPTTLDDLARLLSRVVGISLRGGLDGRLAAGLDEAARAAREPVAVFARRALARQGAALEELVEHVVVLETVFWRHGEQLATVGRLAATARGPLSIWSAGCATGEVAYSVAIALLEVGRGGMGDRILGTDVSRRALERARIGAYGVRAVRRLPSPLARRWLDGGPVELRVKDEARALVSFAPYNLVGGGSAPGGPFDVVLCPNVFIYFDPDAAVRAVRRLAGALAPGGRLVLGPAELPIGEAAGLVPIRAGGVTLLARIEG